MASPARTDGADAQDHAFREALAQALSLARDPRHVVALSRIYAHAVGALDPDDPLAAAAFAAAHVAVAEDLAAPTPRVARRPARSPYSPVRVSSGRAPAVSPPPPMPAFEASPQRPAAGVSRVPSPDARRPPMPPGTRAPSPDPDARTRRPRTAPPAERPPSPEPQVMPCHRTHRKELRDQKRREERRFRQLLAMARQESAERTPDKGTSRAIARVLRDLAAATDALDAATRLSQEDEPAAPTRRRARSRPRPPVSSDEEVRVRGPFRGDAAVAKRRCALELLRDMRCGR